jgi:hypothetical protein
VKHKIESKSPKTNSRRRQQANKRQTAPRTAAQYNAEPERFKDRWDRIIGVISKMRSEKTSLQKAAKEKGVSPRTVKRWAGSALQQRTSGKWVAKKSDRLLREMKIPTSEGPRVILLRGSRQASKLARYSTAVQRYLETGNAGKLGRFQAQFIRDASGVQIPFLTDLKVLDRLASAGALSFESLYAR